MRPHSSPSLRGIRSPRHHHDRCDEQGEQGHDDVGEPEPHDELLPLLLLPIHRGPILWWPLHKNTTAAAATKELRRTKSRRETRVHPNESENRSSNSTHERSGGGLTGSPPGG